MVYVLSTSHGAAMKNTNKSGYRSECYTETNKYYWLQPQYGWCRSCWSTARQLGCTKKIIQMVQKALSEAGYAMYIGFSQTVQEIRREGWFPFLSSRCLHPTSSECIKIGNKSIQNSHR